VQPEATFRLFHSHSPALIELGLMVSVSEVVCTECQKPSALLQ
jgi:hypothetical protein